MTAGEGPVDGEDEVGEGVTFADDVADMAFYPWVREPLVRTKKAAKAGGSNDRTIRPAPIQCQQFCRTTARLESTASQRPRLVEAGTTSTATSTAWLPPPSSTPLIGLMSPYSRP